ncbi:uncharacterized protein DNG_04040 [Cephalotrichum gorgonifer]|uniref:Uncharacterized protein n=1 Tax=Cephalotrichum gorgonifer TaxID=2041049 RepID=A0AAE8MW90_9PEZI|nr:uncharacterized protein DNG_04040 [Cephalotrichum gorgonifer]
MSDQGLQDGAFFTTLNGRRCTAVPKSNGQVATTTSTTPTTTATPTVAVPSPPAAGNDDVNNVQPGVVPAITPSVADQGEIGVTAATPTSPLEEADNVGNQQQAPVPTLITPVNDPAPDVAAPTAGVNGAAAAGNDQPSSGISDGESGSESGNRPGTAVVAGSVAGGVALVSIIAFLLWFWRKKAINKRRSSLLTPLTIAPSGNKNGGAGGSGAGGTYIIDRDSVGPTAKSEKFRAAVGANFDRLRGKVSRGGPSVDLNRGTSQFMGAQHSRGNSSVLSSAEVTGKDRFKDWWSRLTADVNFNWKLRNDRAGDLDPSAARDMREKNAAMGSSQPDFLTLLGMDENEVQREAKKRQAGAGSGEKRGSASSSHFLGGLSLDFNSSSSNPFSDVNALPHDSAKPAPLTVSPERSADPFSDDKAIKGPSSYVADVRRSRGLDDAKAAPSKVGNLPGRDRMDSVVYRESLQSDVGPRRTKFRSDPFDLERPELLGNRPQLASTAEEVNAPKRVHTRTDSYSSKYSSGFSLGDWSDPGPDVGPAATRWDSPTEEHVGSKRIPRDGSVGKAI